MSRKQEKKKRECLLKEVNNIYHDFFLSLLKLLGYVGLKIATHWSPMGPKIEQWQLNFQNWVTHNLSSN